jgi:Rps23 Pro-64 3,4-dihydroxylase Tpa1-like proline 4-hydroxylase
MIADIIRPFDALELRQRMRTADPFAFCVVDDFLREDFALEVERCFPRMAEAKRTGRLFAQINQRNKVQITDSSLFPEPIARLSAALASRQWLEALSTITGIAGLNADAALSGAGIHTMAQGGYLDPHVDFGMLEQRALYRRVNVQLYFNSSWAPDWGGELEFWDSEVQRRVHVLAPRCNRCVILGTTRDSFHSVSRLRCPPQQTRKSFAAFYYTTQPSAEWTDPAGMPRFRARPGERLKRFVLMPAEQSYRRTRRGIGQALRRLGLRR